MTLAWAPIFPISTNTFHLFSDRRVSLLWEGLISSSGDKSISGRSDATSVWQNPLSHGAQGHQNRARVGGRMGREALNNYNSRDDLWLSPYSKVLVKWNWTSDVNSIRTINWNAWQSVTCLQYFNMDTSWNLWSCVSTEFSKCSLLGLQGFRQNYYDIKKVKLEHIFKWDIKMAIWREREIFWNTSEKNNLLERAMKGFETKDRLFTNANDFRGA